MGFTFEFFLRNAGIKLQENQEAAPNITRAQRLPTPIRSRSAGS